MKPDSKEKEVKLEDFTIRIFILLFFSCQRKTQTSYAFLYYISSMILIFCWNLKINWGNKWWKKYTSFSKLLTYTGGPRISWFHNSWSSQIHDFFQASISWIPRKFMILKRKIAKKIFRKFFRKIFRLFFRFVSYFFIIRLKMINYRRRSEIFASKDLNLW